MLHKALGLIHNIFNGSLFLLDFGIFLSWGVAAEENAPHKDGNVTNNHSQKAGCDSDHNTNENGDNNMHDDTLKEACDSTMSVAMMTEWAVRSLGMLSMGVRAVVMAVGLVSWDTLNSWDGRLLRTTSLQF